MEVRKHGGYILFTLLFGKYQVQIAAEKKYLIIEDVSNDIWTGEGYFKTCNEYKYLGVTFTCQGTLYLDKDIMYKVGQGKHAI